MTRLECPLRLAYSWRANDRYAGRIVVFQHSQDSLQA